MVLFKWLRCGLDCLIDCVVFVEFVLLFGGCLVGCLYLVIMFAVGFSLFCVDILSILML